ncbi:O-methyltransferase [Glutamicibacter uratoxydans]|uniref:O-methyltransferase n=1 Tax=Glutamicibacter uratoxydans TaxID=43667 RepID=UPI003D6F63B7
MDNFSADQHAAAVDQYIYDALELHDPLFEAGRERAHAAGLPQIEVSAAQGKFLKLLIELLGAQRVLEVGTLGGFSTSWMARAVGPQGQVVTCEFEPLHARIATENLRQADLEQRVQINVGAAANTLGELIAQGTEPFDVIFIDADKRNNVTYLELAMDLSHAGTLIIVDNVVRGGAILQEATDAETQDPDIRGIQQTYRWLAEDPRVDATALQTVGSKGWDGLAFARVL